MPRRGRHLEGPDRQRQLDGVQPDRPGAQHRRRDHRRGQRRPVARRSPSTCSGEILELKNTINTMVDQLNGFAARSDAAWRARSAPRASSAARPQVPGVAGTWKDLTDNVNSMASNLTGQVRNIADVATAVANGDLSRKITVDVKGEILELKNTINTMVDQLNALRLRSDARGARGRHRRQARRPGAGARRGRHVEGPDRQRQLDGRQPDRPGAQHRRRDDRRGARRPVHARSRST